MIHTNRKGSIGAFLNEYKTALLDLSCTIEGLSNEQLSQIVDTETTDKECVSIQTILTHVVHSGDAYIQMIAVHQGDKKRIRKDAVLFDTIAEYQNALIELYDNNVQLFENISDEEMMEYDPNKKIKANWGQLYDYEQLMEHAIIHVYRHRFQIEKFKVRINA